MQNVSLKDLLEAGCHFGHKKERWHPKADAFIFGEKDGVHIIDLAKTKQALSEASLYVRGMAEAGKRLLLVGTKRQARNVVTEAARKNNIFYLTNRWVGGFLTNFEEVKKNIEKLNRMKKESTDGSWQQFPKHERVQLEKEMRKLGAVYGGVADLLTVPDAVFIVDIKKESNAVSEAQRRGIPIVAMVDTNSDPSRVQYPIPANDDAVGSIKYIVEFLAASYAEGMKLSQKKVEKVESKVEKVEENQKKASKTQRSKEIKSEEIGAEKIVPSDEVNAVEEEKNVTMENVPMQQKEKKKRGRPRKKV
ncbi:30S ribosomal protein S2 [Candidatus Gottesmanbacteria bacterium]|nr:30S ribosomal protein S2 [Candidatus Gottesmanbacteria bacterium]